MGEVRWERMFPDELEAAIADTPVVYFAYGLCEPHGPQNAVGLDALKARYLLSRGPRPWRHRRPARLLAYPRDWPLCVLGRGKCGRSALLADRGATLDPLQEHLLSSARGGCLGLPRGATGHRPLWPQLARLEGAA